MELLDTYSIAGFFNLFQAKVSCYILYKFEGLHFKHGLQVFIYFDYKNLFQIEISIAAI